MKTRLLLLTLLWLSACSSTKLSYSFLDNWLQWRIDDYIQLNASQQRFTTAQINDFHRWHRHTQLDAYSAFIDDTITLLDQQTLTTEQLDKHLQTAITLWDKSVEYLLPAAVEILQNLDGAQTDSLLANIEKRQARNHKKNAKLSIDEKQLQRLQRTEKTLTKWLGSINTNQQHILEQWVGRIDYMSNARTERQRIWNQTFRGLLTQNGVSFDMNAARLVFMDTETLWTKDYAQRFEKNKMLFFDTVIKIHAELNGEQRQLLAQRLHNYKNDFILLATK